MSLTGEISAPPRSSRFGAAVVFALVLIWALPDMFPGFLSGWLSFRAFLLMLPLAVISRSLYAVHLNLLFLCICIIKYFPHIGLFPFTYLTAFVLYAYTVFLVKELGHSVGWVRLGRFNSTVWMLILATIIISCLALVLWVHFVSPNLSRYKSLVPNTSLSMALLFGFAFCTFNAAVEEIIWRGVMMEALDSAFGPGLLVMLVQALSFAVAHFRGGFPNGWTGSAMVFIYGIMLGTIRRASKGIAGPWLAHSAADFTIFCLILYFTRHSAK